MRSVEVLARQAPRQLSEAMGLELSPKRARLLGVTTQAIVMGDGDHKARVTVTRGAMPAQATGVVLSAVPPGSAQVLGRHMPWGGLSTALIEQWWPAEVRSDAESLAVLAGDVQSEVDKASVAKPETTWEALTGGASVLSSESRFTVAMSALLGPTWGCVEGPSWRPVVSKARDIVGGLEHRVELCFAGSPQLALLVSDPHQYGPTWQKRFHRPERYVACMTKMTESADKEMQPGGWLRGSGDSLVRSGWQIVPGGSDQLLAAAGVASRYLLRPPNAAGLLWRAPAGKTLGEILGSLQALEL